MISYNRIKQIHVELSSTCNASCPNCPRNVDGGYQVPWLNKKTFTLEDFKEVFPEELIARVTRFLFCGNYGDPAMCVDTPKIVRWIHSINPTVGIRIHTNGGIRPVSWWKELAEAMDGMEDGLVFSIDGLSDTNHIYRRNVLWKRLMENVQAYIGAGAYTVWEFLIFEHNEHQIEEARKFSKQMGFKQFVPKKAFGFEFMGSNRPRMRVLDKHGNFERFIFEPLMDSHLNHTGVQENTTDLVDDRIGIPPQDYKNAYDNTKTALSRRTDSFDYLDDNEIDCMAIRGQEIYVDSNFGVHPCCFLGHVSQSVTMSPENLQYLDWIETNIGFDNINAKRSSIREILATDYFDKIEQTWHKKHSEGRIAICSRMCKKLMNPVTNLYVKNEQKSN